jgi:class 3 adenylate cyclase
MKRRLTAILAADVVGYSRLMGVNESGTLTALDKAAERFRQSQNQRTSGTNR